MDSACSMEEIEEIMEEYSITDENLVEYLRSKGWDVEFRSWLK